MLANSAGVKTVPGFARRTLREMAASILESTVRRGRASRVVLACGDVLAPFMSEE
jgi:hypothetical protein